MFDGTVLALNCPLYNGTEKAENDIIKIETRTYVPQRDTIHLNLQF
jgi:hypothetical protein